MTRPNVLLESRLPFEARRYGFATVAIELNPVAAVVLKATLDYPARYGQSLAADIKRWGQEWAKRVNDKLAHFFPKGENENIFAYLWARTVACPVTGKPVPLSPNWWLSKGKKPAAWRGRCWPNRRSLSWTRQPVRWTH
jgi:adenine-specific DNA methylase